jgi:hypothetical protein
MFANTIPVTEVIASIERQLAQLREHLEQHTAHPMQLPPTNSYWLGVGPTNIGSIVSLDLVQSGGGWEPHREHWFNAGGVDYAKEFGSQEDLTITPDIQCGSAYPCATLQVQMNSLAQSWNPNFQMYALGLLTPSDWNKNPPSVGPKLYSFAAAGTDPTRPRMVFDVDPQDTTKLNQIIWLTDDASLSSYPVQPMTLQYQGTSMPTAKYYYVAHR